MSGKWTPGPWVVSKDGHYVLAPGGFATAEVRTGLPKRVQHANARLIAAAPTVTEALARLVAAYNGSVGTAAGHTELLNALEAAETALAKAGWEG